MDIVLMQLTTGSDTPIINYILFSLDKSGVISTICHKYGKSSIETVSFPPSWCENDFQQFFKVILSQ